MRLLLCTLEGLEKFDFSKTYSNFSKEAKGEIREENRFLSMILVLLGKNTKKPLLSKQRFC